MDLNHEFSFQRRACYHYTNRDNLGNDKTLSDKRRSRCFSILPLDDSLFPSQRESNPHLRCAKARTETNQPDHLHDMLFVKHSCTAIRWTVLLLLSLSPAPCGSHAWLDAHVRLPHRQRRARNHRTSSSVYSTGRREHREIERRWCQERGGRASYQPSP